jgi:hypothetical protein
MYEVRRNKSKVDDNLQKGVRSKLHYAFGNLFLLFTNNGGVINRVASTVG